MITMLSQVAERVYWMARYLERAEKTARLIHVHTSLLMDLPDRMEIDWYTLVRLFNAEQAFREQYGYASEQNIMQFLVADRNNPSSLASSLGMVRENIRTSLNVLPEEVWEQANRIHLLVNESLPNTSDRHLRQVFVRQIMEHCQCIRGALDSHMSRDNTFDFMQIGKHIERADMSTRILEMTSLLLADDRSDTLRRYEGILWGNLLQALSARQMYMQHVHSRLNGVKAMNFLLKDTIFPGSVSYSLAAIVRRMCYLPHPEYPIAKVQRIRDQLASADITAIPADQIHVLMDSLQGEMGVLQGQIANTWFYPTFNQTQTQSQSGQSQTQRQGY